MKIERGTTVRGSFQLEGDLVLEGGLEGTVQVTGRLVVEAGGALTGEVRCSGGAIRGRVSGTLHSDQPMEVDPRARITGRLIAPALEFGGVSEPGDRIEPDRSPARLQAGERDRDRGPSGPVHGRPPTVTGDLGQVIVQPTAILGGGR